jgi:vacuolar-type H+-ATPase subunit H
MNVMSLLDYLQEEVEDANKVPFSENCMIDRDKLLDMINDIRSILPNEIMEAETIRNQRAQILEDAEKEAEAVLAEAEQKMHQMVEENAITQMAYQQAEEIIENAQNGAREIRRSANEYVEEILTDLENYVQRNLDIVRQNREQMRGR